MLLHTINGVFTRHKRAGLVAVMLEETGLECVEDAHRDNQQSHMKQSGTSVKRFVQSFESLINPFDIVDCNSLITLSSGMEVMEEVAA